MIKMNPLIEYQVKQILETHFKETPFTATDVCDILKQEFNTVVSPKAVGRVINKTDNYTKKYCGATNWYLVK